MVYFCGTIYSFLAKFLAFWSILHTILRGLLNHQFYVLRHSSLSLVPTSITFSEIGTRFRRVCHFPRKKIQLLAPLVGDS